MREAPIIILMAWHSPLVTETMTGTVVTVLPVGEEHGGTITVPTQTSMGCTSVVRATMMVSRGTISMLLQEVGALFAIRT